MERLQQLMMRGGAGGAGGGDGPVVDTAEMVYISSLALLKMLKHGRAGVPMEVRWQHSPFCEPNLAGPPAPRCEALLGYRRRCCWPQAKPLVRAGRQVMGLMLGQFVDEYTVRVIDVFAMPQSGTGVSVEAVDPVFQTKMLDMLKQARLAPCPRGHVLPGPLCPIL